MLFAPKEIGQSLLEYALVLIFIAVVVIVVLKVLGSKVGGVFSKVNNSLSGL
jgi:pilus assembly protein Flp/PilA